MKQQWLSFLWAGALAWVLLGCAKSVAPADGNGFTGFAVPANFSKPAYDMATYPVTQAGFELGRKLFYDARLSRDNTISCGSCHIQGAAFTHHGHDVSHGIEDRLGKRNAPALQNMAWYTSFMWDGGIGHLDLQPIAPIENPVEMDESLGAVIAKLKTSTDYPPLFEKAFGSRDISSGRMLQAMSQFMNMLVSANSKYDRVMRKEGESFTPDEQAGYELFKARCATCHQEPLFTNQQFMNNGIGIGPNNDMGRYEISLIEKDKYTFKVPSLRNVMITAPYMHDGRLRTIDAVLRHYAEEVQSSPNLAPALSGAGRLGIPLTSEERTRIKAFLATLTDDSFIRNPAFAEQ